MLHLTITRSPIDSRRIQLVVYTDAYTAFDGSPILLGCVNLAFWEEDPPFTVKVSGIWLQGAHFPNQPCTSFADGLRRFVAIERLITRHGLEQAGHLLRACQAMNGKS